VKPNIFRKKAGAKKSLSRNNIKASYETSITFHDKNFNIISANKTAKEMLGLPSLIGNKVKCYKYYHGKDSPPKQCPNCTCLLSGKPGFFQFFEPHLHKCIQVRAFPQFDNNYEFKGVFHFVRDITHECTSLDNHCCE
jgi:hypothetical protein